MVRDLPSPVGMQLFFLRYRWAPLATGAALLAAVVVALFSVGAFSAIELPRGFASHRQLLGVNLLLILIPAYLIGAWGFLVRRSGRLLAEIDAQLPEGGFEARLKTPVAVLLGGGGLGAVYAVLFNLPVGNLQQLLDGGSLLICLVVCMILVWVCAGVVLASRLHVSNVFRDAGEWIPLDPYDQTSLGPFARAGMGDMALTVGALVLTTVQSIDATVRYENYLYAMAVAVPAALVLLLRPMSTIHQRIKVLKSRELTEINDRIAATSKQLEDGAMVTLEVLLQRRDRIRAIATWPVDIAMMSRLIVYGIIPPVAWTAAAVVEQFVGDLLGG